MVILLLKEPLVYLRLVYCTMSEPSSQIHKCHPTFGSHPDFVGIDSPKLQPFVVPFHPNSFNLSPISLVKFLTLPLASLSGSKSLGPLNSLFSK